MKILQEVKIKKPNRFFRTSNNFFINIDLIICFKFDDSNDDATWGAVIVTQNFNFNHIGIIKKDKERFLSWLESHGLDSPESEVD